MFALQPCSEKRLFSGCDGVFSLFLLRCRMTSYTTKSLHKWLLYFRNSSKTLSKLSAKRLLRGLLCSRNYLFIMNISKQTVRAFLSLTCCASQWFRITVNFSEKNEDEKPEKLHPIVHLHTRLY